jgi:hypothetical protein
MNGLVVVLTGIDGVLVRGVVFEDSPWVSSCSGPRRACISGSSKTRLLCSVSLCLNQLMMSCPFCCVVRGSIGLIGVRSLLKDLRGMVCRYGDVSTLRGRVLLTVRPLGLGEEFRDGGRFSKIKGG